MIAFQISQDSVQTTLAAGAVNVAIPTAADGVKAKYLLISSDDVGALFRPNLGGAETVGSLAALPPNSYMVINVWGYSHIRCADLGTTGGTFTITPLDNQ